MLDPCFVMQYFESFLVLQSSHCGREILFALLLLSSVCHVDVIVYCLFLTVIWVGLQCVIVSFPGHTHLRSFLEKVWGYFFRHGIHSSVN